MSFTVDEIEDLKQILAANNRVLKSELKEELTLVIEEKLEEKLEQKLEQKLAPIHQKIDDLTAFVQDAITTSNDVNQEQLDDHEVRITRLEKAAA